jgi:TP901 family phage tail tape measure protein
MADFRIAINLVANDGASGVIKGMRAELARLNSEARKGPGGRKRKGDSDPWLQGPSSGELHNAASSIGQMGRAAGGALKAPIMLAANFEAAMNRLNALSGGTFATEMTENGSKLDVIAAKARQLGKDTEFTASQAAEGFQILTQAGFKYDDQLKSIGSVLDFATVGQVDMATAALYMTDALGGFGLKAVEATRVGNAMTRASLASQIELKDLGEAFKYAAPQATKLGYSVEQVGTALAVLGKAGVRGSMGGTSLRAFFNRLAGATGEMASDKQKAAMKMLGIDKKTLKKAVESGDLAAVPRYIEAAVAKQRTKGLGMADEVSAYQGLFTERGGLGAMIMVKSMTKDVTELTDAQKEMYAAAGIDAESVDTQKAFANSWDEVSAAANDTNIELAKTAGQIRSGTLNSMKVLESSMEELGITVGEKLLPQLQPLLEKVIKLTGEFADWSKENGSTIRNAARFAAVLAAISVTMAPLLMTLATTRTLLKTAAWLSGLSTAIKATGAASAVAAPQIGAVAGKVTLLNKAHGVLGAFATGVTLGLLADQYLGISDAIAGVNQELSIMDGGMGFSKKGKNAFLEDMTAEEKLKLGAHSARLAELQSEYSEIEDAGGPIFGPLKESLEEKILHHKGKIDAIQETASKRGVEKAAFFEQARKDEAEHKARRDAEKQARDQALGKLDITVKVDQAGQVAGVQYTDPNTGVLTEGM